MGALDYDRADRHWRGIEVDLCDATHRALAAARGAGAGALWAVARGSRGEGSLQQEFVLVGVVDLSKRRREDRWRVGVGQLANHAAVAHDEHAVAHRSDLVGLTRGQ